MKIKFYKYHGAGNDFILIDNRIKNYHLNKKDIAYLCKRRFGIGADGLMILEEDIDFDFRMRYYNSDGAEGSMCGNGGRCIVAFAHYLGIISKKANFIAIDGKHSAVINHHNNDSYNISLEMSNVTTIDYNSDSYFLDTGSPHHISFVENLDFVDVVKQGRKIRYSEKYKSQNGTNVNFIEIMDGFLKIRTYERGVEDETYACGTGATAAAIAYAHKINNFDKEIKIKALGGDLSLSFKYNNDIVKEIVLRGPAEFVFKGETEINGY